MNLLAARVVGTGKETCDIDICDLDLGCISDFSVCDVDTCAEDMSCTIDVSGACSTRDTCTNDGSGTCADDFCDSDHYGIGACPSGDVYTCTADNCPATPVLPIPQVSARRTAVRGQFRPMRNG